MKYKNIIVLGDSHTPYTDMQLIKQAAEFAKQVKADFVLSVGDMIDQKAWSRFPKDPDDDSPELEWQKTKKQCIEIAKYFPTMTVLCGNHDRRYVKKAKEAGLVKDMVRPLNEMIPNKGWTWHTSPEPFVLNGNIACLHGDELSGHSSVKATKLGMNVIQGHTHRAELQYVSTFNKKLWSLDVGTTANVKAKAFDYSASSLIKQWSGFGWIQDGVPHLIPKKVPKK